MKSCFFLLVFTALILTAAPSEARSRSRRSSDSGGGYSGGGLSRDRGISSVEADEIGAVVNEIAHSPTPPKSTGARKRSADYYRVYSKQRQAVAAKPGKVGRAIFRPKTDR